MGSMFVQGAGVSEDQGQQGASQPLILLRTLPSLRIFFFLRKICLNFPSQRQRMEDLGWGGVGMKEGHIASHGKDGAKENPAFDVSFSGRKPEAQGLAAPSKPHGP